MHEVFSCGFPHSEISGSMCMCHPPKLIAASHVLHRLSVPRHPPCALYVWPFVLVALFDHSVDRITQESDLSIFFFCIKCSLLSRQESKCKTNSFEFAFLWIHFDVFLSSWTILKYWLRLDYLESFVYSVFKVRIWLMFISHINSWSTPRELISPVKTGLSL